jgi:coenzyme PQQ precursor peptide PqqA
MARNCHISFMLAPHRHRRHLSEVELMQWQTPKLVEIACGCEINAYFPADL